MYASLPLSPRLARHFPRKRGQLTIKEERNYSFKIFIYTPLTISFAGFFAMSHMMFFLHRHSDSVHRSRMTAGVSIFRKAVSDFSLNKRKDPNHEPSPNTGKVAALAVGRGKCEQKRKTVSYKTALHTCLSFLNEVKNLARDTGINSSVLCTQTCPYRLAGSALPSEFGGS